jgi:uncharacterized phage protein gp47/JayE
VALNPPVINFPTTEPGFSTNLINQTIKGTTDPGTSSIFVNGSSGDVIFASGNTDWTFVTVLESGDNVYSVTAVDASGVPSTADTITITLTQEDDLNLIVSSPTGITLERGRNIVKVAVIENPEPEVIGYNFYGSEEPGGGTNGFTLLNSTLITDFDFFKEETLVLSETVETSGNVRETCTVEQVFQNRFYSYIHDKTVQVLGNIPISEANHYVVTAVAFDQTLLQQVESPFSSELGAAPLLLDTSIRDLPLRNTEDVQDSYIDQILTTDNEIDVKPGTITRDIHINPPSDEFARLYIIQDFMHRSQSFLTLLEFDDPDGDGVSDPVLTTVGKLRLKEALLVEDENVDQIQQLIDDAFTKLAGNVNVPRKSAQRSQGQLLFFTRSTPTKDSTINAGGVVETLSDETTEPVQFEVLTDFTLTLADLDNYYNPTTERYEVLLDAQSIEEGDFTNVDADKIRVVVSGIDSIFGVTNPNPTEFGQDIESNKDLAERAILAFVSVDVGTEAGYLATTLGTPNVSRAKIISAGETLMQRDIDPLRLVHTFGKVDIYIQGSIQTTKTDEFGFTFATVKNEQVLIQSVPLFHFNVTNPEVTVDKPIFEVIEVKNVSKSANYDTTGFQIIGNGQVVDLDENLSANVSIGLDPTDVIQISYRYRDSDPYVFNNQPVESITSVIGEISGPLTADNYELQKLEDPLSFGNSTSAQDQMVIKFANGLPTGGIKTVADEPHLLFGENEVELDRFGIDSDTIVVTDNTNTTTYIKDTDYFISAGDLKTKTTIRRSSTSSIPEGATVLVDYEAGENITVNYTVNSLLSDVQNRIDDMRHLTADVVVKNSIRTFIDIDLKVLIEEGSDQTSIDRKIRTAIAKLMNEKQIGESIYQSDIIEVVESINGVVHQIIPYTKMVKADGSLVIREQYSGEFTPFQTVNVTSYKSNSPLSWTTTEGGGPSNLFRGVFENDIPLETVDTASEVAEAAGRAYIDSSGFLYVSLQLGNINDASITTTYVVEDASGARDIDFSDIEYGAVGTLSITFDFLPKFTGF